MNWKKNNVVSSKHNYPVFANVEVLVIGGGAAGVAAAETASRHGRNVMLIEKYGFCGGAAVAGLSGTICGLYLSSEKKTKPEQVVFGFTERFRAEMERRGGITAPLKYGHTWTVTHDPLVWREVAEDFLIESNVNILYHTSLVGVVMDDESIKGVIINTKSGLAAIHADVVIDASGDADVIYRAGFHFNMGEEGKIQNPTMIFRLGGINVERFLEHWGSDTICSYEVTNLINELNKSGQYELPRSKIWIFKTSRPNELLVNATRIIGKDKRELNATNPADHTEAEYLGRHQVREYARFLKENIKGCEDSFINDTGIEVGIRQTRTIDGVDRLTNEDVLTRRKRSNGIVRSPWPIELHSGEKPKVEWLLDDYYEVPFETLIPKKGENVIVAGRCLSAEHEALASARVTAQCFAYGQAAGLAAVESINNNIPIRNINGIYIRDLLNKDGAKLS
ncbi:FAD-dependent oxidoreductase [Domibacillus mangrovi]|uniref:FAD-dependent oxidoreductase n=1 Tax=Domibacillus mangrovi TaxID=1714354 RepID=A0A1Q5P2Y5_9BACI|nr:FAD-dependent oxidoreductase [Domibacillus mangrovi]OKL36607.1 FAD-dependent oxidoreductase [Domibacillus mangrovi]